MYSSRITSESFEMRPKSFNIFEHLYKVDGRFMKIRFWTVLGRRSRPGRLQDGSQTKPSNPKVAFPFENGTRCVDFGNHFGFQIN